MADQVTSLGMVTIIFFLVQSLFISLCRVHSLHMILLAKLFNELKLEYMWSHSLIETTVVLVPERKIEKIGVMQNTVMSK